MTTERLEELGWKFDDYYINRAFYSKKNGTLKGFALFEHDGDWGIMNPYRKDFSLIYCNMTDKMIEQYINYVNEYEELTLHPKDHTFAEYLKLEINIKKFVEKMNKRG